MSTPKWGSHYDDVDVLCPFYIASNQQKKLIVCEGVRRGIKTMLRFGRREDQAQYMKEHCELHYKRCPYQELARKKYETGD